MKVAMAKRTPASIPTTVMPLSVLKPITKIQEPHFYEFVKDNIRTHGLYHPLVVRLITIKDWREEAELDKHQLLPTPPTTYLHYRIQCGCNRYFALKELEYDYVECYVIDTNNEEASDLCWRLRTDKRWQRGSNWENT